MSLTDQVRARKRRAAAISVLAVPATFVLLLVLGVVALPWAIVVGFFIYFRMTRSGRCVLWLRRFHRSEPARLRFNMLLNRACTGLCVPVTVQDSAFKTSYYSASSQLVLVAPLVFGLGAVFYLLCAVTIAAGLAKLGVGGDTSIGLGLLVALVPLAFFGTSVKKQMFKRGHVSLTSRNAIEQVDSTLQRIARRKLGFQGVMIFKCPDEVWRQVVSLGISRASSVIIDVSELTENVLWEARTTLEKHRPDSVLLAYGVPRGASEELPRAARAELERAVGADALSRLRVFYYPAEQPPPGPARGRLYMNLSRKLSVELATCIEHAPA